MQVDLTELHKPFKSKDFFELGTEDKVIDLKQEKDSVCPCPLEPLLHSSEVGGLGTPLLATVFWWKLRMINLEMAFQDIM